jgi:hypothetical protein
MKGRNLNSFKQYTVLIFAFMGTSVFVATAFVTEWLRPAEDSASLVLSVGGFLGIGEGEVTLGATVSPIPLPRDSDATVKVAVSETSVTQGVIHIRLVSESFAILPESAKIYSSMKGETPQFGQGDSFLFVATPRSTGNKKIGIYAQHSGDLNPVDFLDARNVDIIDIPVIDEAPRFLGIAAEAWSAIRNVAAIIGFPGILLLLLSRLLDARKARRSAANARTKIVIPDRRA